MREYLITCEYFGHDRLRYPCPTDDLEKVVRQYIHNSFWDDANEKIFKHNPLKVVVVDCQYNQTAIYEVEVCPDISVSCHLRSI